MAEGVRTIVNCPRSFCLLFLFKDPHAKMVRELKEEIERLKAVLSAPRLSPNTEDQRDTDGEMQRVNDQLQSTEKLMATMSETYEEKVCGGFWLAKIRLPLPPPPLHTYM